MKRRSFVQAAGATGIALVLAPGITQAQTIQDVLPELASLEEIGRPTPISLQYLNPLDDYNMLVIQWEYQGLHYAEILKIPFSTTESIVPELQPLLVEYSKKKLARFDPSARWEDVTNIRWLTNFDNNPKEYGVQTPITEILSQKVLA